MSKVYLPAVVNDTTKVLDTLTTALGVPRSVLASDEEIESAWGSLPSVLTKIPPELRDEQVARACVAVGVGLFDSAINYIWNQCIVHLRLKVKKFGLNVVGQIIGKTFDDAALLDLKDAELLSLCLKLNLVTEQGYFYLDQCRDIRNNFSAAHPSVGPLDDHEVISFINRCAKHALSTEISPKGVDVHAFIGAVKGGKFKRAQKEKWIERIEATHDAQREMLIGTLHGIFCDSASSEGSRVNAISISEAFVGTLPPKTKSELIDRHSDYLAQGDEKRHQASVQFFERLGLLALLSEHERHSLITNTAKKLLSVHQGFDNFYNEPPFAERLSKLLSQAATPDTAKPVVVEGVVTCAAGNPYGVSHAAVPYYDEMIKSFTPAEIGFMLSLPGSKTIVASRIKNYPSCRKRYRKLVGLLDASSIPAGYKTLYNKWK
jgi:hypothetical protein